MSDAYLGEIRIFGFPRIPTGWFACDGSLKPIAQYDALFALLGTNYGGDGVTTFAVPDLRGRLPLHKSTAAGLSPHPLGQISGTETVTLNVTQIPSHTHTAYASTTTANTPTPGPSVVPANQPADLLYVTNLTGLAPLTMASTAIGANVGGPIPHDNLMPTLTASFCICWAGEYPSQG